MPERELAGIAGTGIGPESVKPEFAGTGIHPESEFYKNPEPEPEPELEKPELPESGTGIRNFPQNEIWAM